MFINDIIILNLIPSDHMHHLWKVFGRFKKHNLMFHPSKWWFLHTQLEYLSQMIFPSGLGVQKAKVEAISQVSQPTYVNRL
jgi:hypothetical protein